METEAIKKINQDLPPGATPLEPEELEELIPKHVTTRKDLYDAEFTNIGEARNYYMLKRNYEFNIQNLYKVHKDMFGNVWSWAGKKRLTDKNIGIDKHQIDVHLKVLIDDLHYWIDNEMDVIEISARLHHRLVYIHPFNNGNGRWARFIVNLFLIDKEDSILDIPEHELLHSTDLRQKYISALMDADVQNFVPLMDFHTAYISDFSI